MDIFKKLSERPGPLGQYSSYAHGYFMFPTLEGDISNRMKFRGEEKIIWSLNNYLGLANHPEVREADAKGAADFGLARPMGARMMSGDSPYHQQLENELSEFVQKEDTFLLNYGYQGVVSILDCMLDRHDILVYDAESHACIVDGARLHMGKRFAFKHNDIESLEKQLKHASNLISDSGGILVVTEGVFGMSGNQGKLKDIVALKKKYKFRIFIDDAHGFGVMGPKGEGTHIHQEVQDDIDMYFSTFAKSMASIGAFVSADKEIVSFLRYNMRSQIFAKSLPLPLVIGDLKRLELIKRSTEHKDKLWVVVNKLQEGLKERGLDIGTTNSCVTPIYLKGTVPEAANLIIDLRENYGIFCSLVVYPVIPKGEIMIRIVASANHTNDDISKTLEAFTEIKQKLNDKYYSPVDVVFPNK